MDLLSLGSRDLLLAVFRLAVCDLRGIAYGHDEPAPMRRLLDDGRGHEAGDFLRSEWAAELADLAGLPIGELRRRARLANPTALGGVR